MTGTEATVTDDALSGFLALLEVASRLAGRHCVLSVESVIRGGDDKRPGAEKGLGVRRWAESGSKMGETIYGQSSEREQNEKPGSKPIYSRKTREKAKER